MGHITLLSNTIFNTESKFSGKVVRWNNEVKKQEVMIDAPEGMRWDEYFNPVFMDESFV